MDPAAPLSPAPRIVRTGIGGLAVAVPGWTLVWDGPGYRHLYLIGASGQRVPVSDEVAWVSEGTERAARAELRRVAQVLAAPAEEGRA